nr:PHB depolymerase family esterase [uncultured Caldimonas sp.]
MKSAACTVRAATCALLALGLQAAGAAETLPSLAIDREGITVSGLSSGGYMAVQLQVAYAATFSGVAAVAAGPYYCAEGSARHASERCLTGEPEPPVTRLAAITRAWAALGLIDATHHLRHTRAYLFSGQRDSVVRPAVTDALARYLRAFVPEAATRYRNDVPAEHGMVTDDHGQPCGRKGRPFINDCDFDLAGELLAHLYGPLQPRGPSQPPGGRFVEFDQREFIRGRGMADSGWLFVPDTCQRDTGCRLHVVLHGCGQNTQRLGDEYVRHTGYNRWAATNRIVMLYPQTSSDAPHACWDWWGYTGPHYAQRTAPQMGAIKAMVERLTGR